MDRNLLEIYGDQWNEWIAKELKLDPNNTLHRAAAFALSRNKHLYEAATKTTARKFEKKLDKVTEQALQLSEAIKSLESRYRDGLSLSLNGQHNIGINNCDNIDYFIQSLAQAAQSVKNVYLSPIPNGYYNGFLFQFIEGVLRSYEIDSRFTVYLILNNIQQPAKSEAKEFLHDLWNNHYLTKVREIAIHVIQIKLSTSKNKQTAQKTVDAHLNKIVDERLENKASKLIRFNNISAEEIVRLRAEMGLN